MASILSFFQTLLGEITSFFGLDPLIDMARTGDYSRLQTYSGIVDLTGALIPFLLVCEIVRTFLFKKFRVDDYRLSFFTIVFNRFVGRFLAIGVTALCIKLFEPWAIFTTRFTWYWLIYGYIIWELSHFVYHFLAHKVRLLWCLHATHHVPQSMNLSVTYVHFFLEAPYADLIRTTGCILLGVNPPMLFFIMFIDGTWGAFIHVGEHLLKDGRLGWLNRIILTPSHHRVHHARNPLYMDTNFCNLLNVWDKAFGTFQPEDKKVPIEYGISRQMNPNHFMDAYFGEIGCLWRDVKRAPGIKNKFFYLIKPPGWSHEGAHKTASVIRKSWKGDPANSY